jgi:hypothetical protein
VSCSCEGIFSIVCTNLRNAYIGAGGGGGGRAVNAEQRKLRRHKSGGGCINFSRVTLLYEGKEKAKWSLFTPWRHVGWGGGWDSIVSLFLTSVLHGVSSQRHAPTAFPPVPVT